jgi:hypothetical protein
MYIVLLYVLFVLYYVFLFCSMYFLVVLCIVCVVLCIFCVVLFIVCVVTCIICVVLCIFELFYVFCVVLCIVCVVLCIFVLFYVLLVLCRSVYCLSVNVYCTTATGWLPNYLLTYLLHGAESFLRSQPVNFADGQEIPRIYGTRRFLTVPTSVHHLSLS